MDLDSDPKSSDSKHSDKELREEVKRMEKEIKRLKTGWSDSNEKVTSLRSLLIESEKELEDSKTKAKMVDNMVIQVREGF